MKLRKYLGEKHLTQREFGEKIGRSQQAIARYCNGRVPDPDTMELIVKETAGEVEPNDFYDLPARSTETQASAA